MIKCNRCLFNENIAKIGIVQCEYCDLHDYLENKNKNFNPILEKIQQEKGKYNCIMGISGGLDSSTLLYSAVKKWKLKPLVIHFNNNWNTKVAEQNMKKLIQILNVDLITYNVNKEEFDNLNKAFLKAGVPDADIPNDIAMTKLMYDTADKYNIKYILNGHCFRTEGSTPKGWTYMDAKYIQSVYKTYYNKELTNFPLFTFTDQMKDGIKGIIQGRPYHYQNVNRKILDKEMKNFIKWENYGWKHGENIYTDFVGSYLLPRKFGIDKRIVYLSALVRSGYMDKEEAINKLNIESNYDTSLIGDEYLSLINSKINSRDKFEKYDFKKYKWIIYYLYLIGVVPYTFYKKYSESINMNYNNINELNEQDKNFLINKLKNNNYGEEINEIISTMRF